MMGSQRARTASVGAVAVGVVCFAFILPSAAVCQQVPVIERTLDNGMQVLMVEKHDAPTIICGIFFNVGASDEITGITGISHLFEHMMFKGSRVVGISDYRRDQEIMDRLDEIKAQGAYDEILNHYLK